METNNVRHNQNGVVQPLLTDLYQITMAYAYWKSGKVDDMAVFDLYFRKNPFDGEFTIFAGLDECLKFLENFRYSDSDIEYLKQTLSDGIENEFFDYLQALTAKDVVFYAIDEGSVAFPRVPIIKVVGPLIIVQLLETTLLTLVNYASLMATNAARYRLVAGKQVKLLEFGLRRAQGPDGGLSASKYAYIGGFDGTSNVLAGKLFNIPVRGTHAHAYITSFSGLAELKTVHLRHKTTGVVRNILEMAVKHRQELSPVLKVSPDESSDGELAAMVSFAIAFPDGFMALVDTYDVKSDFDKPNSRCKSAEIQKIKQNKPDDVHKNGFSDRNKLNGLKENSYNIDSNNNHNNIVRLFKKIVHTNHINGMVQLDKTLNEPHSKHHEDLKQHNSNASDAKQMVLGQKCKSRNHIRSGILNFCAVAMALNDQGYRAIGIRIDSGDLAYLSCFARQIFDLVATTFNILWFKTITIVASNDINEETILSLNEQNHKIDCFGIGTHLVTCQRQPALGCVYKLVEINGQARIKLSQDVEKVTMPGNKNVYRLYSDDGHALIDLMQRQNEPPPKVGEPVLCRHPFQEIKRAKVTPSRVESLYKVYWKDGQICRPLPTLEQIRENVKSSLNTLRNDHKRSLNPTPYKVSVSDELYKYLHTLWLENAPIGELA